MTADPFVSFLAGPIKATSLEPNPTLGQQVTMGPNLYFNITSETARQWIGVLETIAKDNA